MWRIGAHTSTAKSLETAVLRAAEIGGNCCQIFSGSPRTWRNPMPKPEACAAMQAARKRLDVGPVVIHANYLINLATNDATVRANSVRAFRSELERGLVIGADYLVLHPGSYKGHDVAGAIAAFSENMAAAAEGLAPGGLMILLENTAGAGSILGARLEELAVMGDDLRSEIAFSVGYCLDTCHLLASGYNVADAAGLEQTLRLVEATLGLANVRVLHMNDSKTPLGSRRDRHEHIGKGYIGLEGFRRIVNHTKLQDKAMILETPEDEERDHAGNLAVLRELRRTRRASG